jgi:hypothetical protein
MHGRTNAAASLEAGELRENPSRAMRERERERRMRYLNIMLFLLQTASSMFFLV